MGRIGTCNECGHRQLVGDNPVDRRWKWWTRCEKCKCGNFLASPDPRIIDLFRKAYKRRQDTLDSKCPSTPTEVK